LSESSTQNLQDQWLLILDFGSQYTQLIARRVRESGVYCEIQPFDVSEDYFSERVPNGVILSGGPETVTEGNTPRIPDEIFELGVPVLGICYGMQALASQLGGEVESSDRREFGHAKIKMENESELMSTLDLASDAEAQVWMSHGDKVVRLPEGFSVTVSTDSAPIAAMEDASKNIFAVQFHPEVTHTPNGEKLIGRFAKDICGCDGEWTIENIAEDAIERIREQVGEDEVVLGLSGGVDSSVVAAILSRAIGDQLTCLFVDNGLLRKDETEEVERAFGVKSGTGNVLPITIKTVNTQKEFLEKLEGIEDP